MLTRRHFLSFFLFFFRGGQRSNGDGTGGREGGEGGRGGRIGVAVFSVAQHTHAHRLYGKVSAHRSIGTSRHIARILHPACVPCPASASLLQANPRPRRQPGRKKKKRSRDNPTPNPGRLNQQSPTTTLDKSGVVLARTITLLHVRGYSCKVLRVCILCIQ